MLMKIWTWSLVFLAWLSFCAWLVLVCREKNVHPLRDFAMFFKKQTTVGRVLFGTFFLIMWVYASVKPGEGLRATNTLRTITAEDFERGFVQTRVGTDEQFDFSPNANATIVSDWRAFGAATDWIYESVKWKVESGKWGTGNGEQVIKRGCAFIPTAGWRSKTVRCSVLSRPCLE